jgi:hypothetical protein
MSDFLPGAGLGGPLGCYLGWPGAGVMEVLPAMDVRYPIEPMRF